MIQVITVEREYGSSGGEFASRLAERLGWGLVDQGLVEEIATEAGVPTSMAETYDERLDPWYYRVGKAFWNGSGERLPLGPIDQVFDSERMQVLVRKYVQEAAKKGKCVIVGRGAACALSQTPHVMHLFVYASMARKIQWFVEHYPAQKAHARREVEAADTRRANYIRRYFGQDWTDHRQYHLMLNSCIGFDRMVQATMDAAGLAELPSPAEPASVARAHS